MSVHYADDWLTVHQGDCREVMAGMEPESVHCVVTSPPYWGLRDYGEAGQLGLEPTPEAYVANMVAVFREVRRVLRKDGTVWLNLGDSYVSNASDQVPQTKSHKGSGLAGPNRNGRTGLKPKDLVGIPWRVAFALQADGWYLRSDIIWAKPNPMPESVTDRPTKAHEYLFLLTKSARYFYDAEAVAEPLMDSSVLRLSQPNLDQQEGSWRVLVNGHNASHGVGLSHDLYSGPTRNLRSVWTIATQPYPGAHFATFPEALVEPCVKAGCPEGGTVLDPFGGSGTTARVANRLSRKAVLIDLSTDYLDQAMVRNAQSPMGLVG